jgi:hypothetical protein
MSASRRRGRYAAAGAGIAASAAALTAAAAGVLAAPIAVPIALVGGIVAAVGTLHRPSRSDSTPEPLEEQPDYEERLSAIEVSMTGKVPAVVEARVARVIRTLRDTLPRLDQLAVGSHMAHVAVQTATSYLPEALAAYMRLPRSFADKRTVSGGKTPLMVLCDQLDLLGAEMDKVFTAVCQADADALIAHGRFLAEKFGAGSSLDLANG